MQGTIYYAPYRQQQSSPTFCIIFIKLHSLISMRKKEIEGHPVTSCIIHIQSTLIKFSEENKLTLTYLAFTIIVITEAADISNWSALM